MQPRSWQRPCSQTDLKTASSPSSISFHHQQATAAACVASFQTRGNDDDDDHDVARDLDDDDHHRQAKAFIHQGEKNSQHRRDGQYDEERRRGLLLVLALFSVGLTSWSYLVLMVLCGEARSTLGLALAFHSVCCSLLLLHHRLTRATRRVALLLAVEVDLAVLLLGLRSLSDNTHWLVLVPLYLFFLVGRRAGLVAAVAVLPQALLIYANHHVELVPRTLHESILGRCFNSLGFFLCVIAVIFAYEDARRRAMANLVKATQEKSLFLAKMAHELRTPLHGIHVMVRELLASSWELCASSREAAQLISDSSDHLLSLVNDFLDFESMDQLVLERIPFSLTNEALKVINVLALLANKKKIKLQHAVNVHYDVHIGDPLRFRQILYNLLSNAIKFTPEHGNIDLSVTNTADEPDHIQVKVRDTGIGIKQQGHRSIFKLFGQSSPDIKRKFGGSGLGLAICKSICEAMGGDISFTSKPGKETTFVCNLTIPHSVEPSPSERFKPRGEEGESGIDLRGIKVLLVEDNLISQQAGTKMLTNLGAAVKVANNGTECLSMVEHERFDVIFMDCHMPQMDGFEACQAIRNLEAQQNWPWPPRQQQHCGSGSSSPRQETDNAARGEDMVRDRTKKAIPIIALTASTVKEIQQRCLRSGMNGFLRKPFRKEEFLQVVRRVLQS